MILKSSQISQKLNKNASQMGSKTSRAQFGSSSAEFQHASCDCHHGILENLERTFISFKEFRNFLRELLRLGAILEAKIDQKSIKECFQKRV